MTQYLHDIYVNWFKGEENPNLVSYFWGWHKQDNVTLLDQFPLIKINSTLYKYLIYGLNELNEHFLKYIENKTYTRNNTERIKERYCCIVTDGKDVMAIMVNNLGFIHKKSRLIPRQHQLVLEKASLMNNSFELDSEYDVSNYKHYAGFTRKEKILVVNIIEYIETLTAKQLDLITYLLSEWNFKLHKQLLGKSFEEIKNKFIEDIKLSTMSPIRNFTQFSKVIDKVKRIKVIN